MHSATPVLLLLSFLALTATAVPVAAPGPDINDQEPSTIAPAPRQNSQNEALLAEFDTISGEYSKRDPAGKGKPQSKGAYGCIPKKTNAKRLSDEDFGTEDLEIGDGLKKRSPAGKEKPKKPYIHGHTNSKNDSPN